ncbi:hypothetical protein ACFX13_035251 [Malus domestica]
MMRQYLKRRARGISWLTRLTEGTRKKLNTNVRECKNIIVAHADAALSMNFFIGPSEDEFEVHDISQRHIVRLPTSYCNCMEWQIRRIPCKHMCACIIRKRANPKDYCHEFFTKEKYVASYSYHIHPVPDERYWVDDPYDVIYSPPLRKPHGRPTKNRRKEANERKNRGKRKRSYALSCKICGTLGHNRRRCPNGNLEMIQRGGVNLARGTRRASSGVDAPRKIVPNEGIQIGSTHVASQEIESQAPEPSQEIRSQANATNHVVDNQPF